MNPTDRTPLIIALLAELIHEHVAAEYLHDDAMGALATGLSLAVDHGAVAALWPPLAGRSGDDADDVTDAGWLADFLINDNEFGRHNMLPVIGAVARRLADVAASLRVRGDTFAREAEALWGAASRLLSFEAAPAKDSYQGRLSDAMATTMQLEAELAAWRTWAIEKTGVDPAGGDTFLRAAIQVAMVKPDALGRIQRELEEWRRWAMYTHSTTGERGDEGMRLCIDEAQGDERRELDRLVRAHAEEVRALTERLAEATVNPTEIGHVRPVEHVVLGKDGKPLDVWPSDNYPVGPVIVARPRDMGRTIDRTVAANGHTFYWGPTPGELAIVVTLRGGGTIEAIQDALQAEHGIIPGTYRIREVGKTWHTTRKDISK